MTAQQKWWIGALFLGGELLVIGTHPREARALARYFYVTGWNLIPWDVPPPDRFLPR